MCYTCWCEHGRPQIDTPDVRRARDLIDELNKGIKDVVRETELLDLFEAMPQDQWISAIALLAGFWGAEVSEK